MKMNRFAASIAVILCLGFMLSSCSSTPEHARYIPSNAAIVIGINTKELSKKIAWNAITGSKILDKIREEQPKDAAKQLDQAGFKVMSTIYLYAQSNPAQGSNDQLIALIPLAEAAKWEAYIKRVFPAVNIKTVGDRKEALLTDGIYAGWNSNLLIIEGLHDGKENVMGDFSNPVTEDSLGNRSVNVTMPAIIHDEQTLSAEMAKAFSVTKENSLVNDKRFTGNEKGGHDITVWVNYDPIMSKYMGAATMGVNLSTLWKGAAAAGGFSFEKGKIDGNMRYYVSKDLKEAGEELGKTNASTELLNRFPATNLDMIAAWHISPKGLKLLLDKSGLMGFLNLGLMSQNISYDDIVDGFTGDMAYSFSDFKMENKPASDSIAAVQYRPNANYIYALKINKKDAFNKLLKWAIKSEFLKSAGNNLYTIGTLNSQAVIAVNDQYLVSANTAAMAQAYLDGKFKSEKMPEPVKKEVYGHPFGMFVDVQALAGNLQIPAGTNYADSTILSEAKKLLTHITTNGGEFRGDAFSSHITVNFTNKEENSLLELIDFSMMAQAAKEKQAKDMASTAAGATANMNNMLADTVRANH